MICLKLNRFFYGLSRMLHLSEFMWILRSSVQVVFNNFLLIDATDRSKIRSDQKRFFISLSLYPLSFFANTPFKHRLPIPLCCTILIVSPVLRLITYSADASSRSLLTHEGYLSLSSEHRLRVILVNVLFSIGAIGDFSAHFLD